MGLLGDSGESTGDPPGAPGEPQGPCGAPPAITKHLDPRPHLFIYLPIYIYMRGGRGNPNSCRSGRFVGHQKGNWSVASQRLGSPNMVTCPTRNGKEQLGKLSAITVLHEDVLDQRLI